MQPICRRSHRPGLGPGVDVVYQGFKTGFLVTLRIKNLEKVHR